MYNLSISTSFNYDIPIEKQLELIKNAGFNYVSLGSNYEHTGILEENKLINFKQMLNLLNVGVDTIHGYNLDKADSIIINEKLIKCCIELKCPVLVLHLSSFMIKENKLNEIKKITANKLSLLKNLYEQYGVKYAIENLMPGVTTDLVEYAMEITDNKVFGFCYDSAHDQIDGPNPLDLLERYKNRLFAVHISDRIKEFADHVVPGEGFINFNEISRILGNSEYESTLLMEVMMTNSCYKDPKIFLEKTYIKAKEIMEEINKAGKTSHNRFAAESPLKC